MTEQKNLVPKRRFKEFQNTKAWEQRKLGELCQIGDIDHKMPQSVKDGVPYIMTGDFLGINDIDFKNSKLISTEDYEQLAKKIKPEAGDILFARYASVGTVRYVETQIKFLVSYSCAILKHNDIAHGKYLFYYLQANEAQRQIELEVNTGSQRNIGIDSLKKLIILLPQEKEQEKVATFFEKLDNLITLHQCKLEKTKALKSAYLSEMFPSEGERAPKRRFAGFTQSWERRKLGDVSPLRGGYAFQSSSFKKVGVPIIRISNILSNGEVGGEYAYYEEQLDDSKYTLPDGASLLAMSGATTGKVSILKNSENKKIYQNQRVGYFSDKNIIDYTFISILTRSQLFTNQLKSVLVAGAQPNISSKEVDNFEFYFPTNKEEQIKIGNFFNKIENTIALHQRKLEKLQNIKKAYLNEMFI